jgi:hypothetical protein
LTFNFPRSRCRSTLSNDITNSGEVLSIYIN